MSQPSAAELLRELNALRAYRKRVRDASWPLHEFLQEVERHGAKRSKVIRDIEQLMAEVDSKVGER